MCSGPAKDDAVKSLIFQSSVASSGVYTILLSTMLLIFNANLYTEAKWEYFYLNPTDPGELATLNALIASLIITGVISAVGYKIRAGLSCYRELEDRVKTENVSETLNESDPNHSIHLERLDHTKEQVFEKVKQTQLNKSKPRTGTPKRRLSLSLFDNNDRSTSRPRTSSLPTSVKLCDDRS